MSDPDSLDAEEYRRHTRRALLVGGAATFAGAMGWRWIQTQPTDDRIPSVLRGVHETNEKIWSALFRDGHSAPTFPEDQASVLRVNGRHGIREEIDLDSWELRVEGHDGELLGTHTLADVQALPRHEMTIEHKCVEGWSQITTWGGARFSDFAAQYGAHAERDYVSLATPDREYYVGLDRATMLHPQTLLVDQMVGRPLDQEHGAPLRLATPLKYGIKQLKRIGSIRFTDDRPDDYWAERGYDWYAGL
jgi:DMSO/TMAO reductase YedYZ molybdopterin-dependent catalytic subunit